MSSIFSPSYRLIVKSRDLARVGVNLAVIDLYLLAVECNSAVIEYYILAASLGSTQFASGDSGVREIL